MSQSVTPTDDVMDDEWRWNGKRIQTGNGSKWKTEKRIQTGNGSKWKTDTNGKGVRMENGESKNGYKRETGQNGKRRIEKRMQTGQNRKRIITMSINNLITYVTNTWHNVLINVSRNITHEIWIRKNAHLSRSFQKSIIIFDMYYWTWKIEKRRQSGLI